MNQFNFEELPTGGWGPMHDAEQKMKANPFANDMFTSAYPPSGQWKTWRPKNNESRIRVSGIGKRKLNLFKYFNVTGIETINFEMV